MFFFTFRMWLFLFNFFPFTIVKSPSFVGKRLPFQILFILNLHISSLKKTIIFAIYTYLFLFALLLLSQYLFNLSSLSGLVYDCI